MWSLLYFTVVLSALVLLPGWAIISAGGYWKRWDRLQRWILAAGLGIAFYPVLFYLTRFIFPWIHYSRVILLVLNGLFLVSIVLNLRSGLKDQFRFEKAEFWAILIFAVILATRFYIIYLQPYPAWSDSLHHTLLTDIVARTGILPNTLEPFEPASLSMYHLGLYSISGTLEMILQIPAHTALLITAQFLNAVGILGLYFVISRLAGKIPALFVLIAGGLLSNLPAVYVNWGRFTQLASQSILLLAWFVSFEALKKEDRELGSKKWDVVSFISAAILNAGVFLLHFRVAGYYLPLLVISVIWIGWKKFREKLGRQLVQRVIAIGLLSLLLVLPVLIPAGSRYVMSKADGQGAVVQPVIESSDDYYSFTAESWAQFGPNMTVIILTLIMLPFAFRRLRSIAVLMVIWILLMLAIGNVYRLNIPLLQFVNMVLIMMALYLPMMMIIGLGAAQIFSWAGKKLPNFDRMAAILFVLIAAVGVKYQGAIIEPYRYFVMQADLPAMEWIRQNAEPEAVFGINTSIWMGTSPHGTDAGYWIPYFTGRKTTSGTMLHGLAPIDYQKEKLMQSKAIVDLAAGEMTGSQLRAQGIDYIYLGKRGSFTQPELSPPLLEQTDGLLKVYESDGILIYKVAP